MNVHGIHGDKWGYILYKMFLKSCFSQIDKINNDNIQRQSPFGNSTNYNSTNITHASVQQVFQVFILVSKHLYPPRQK